MKTRTKIWISIAVATIVTTLLIAGGFLLIKHNAKPTKQDYITFLKEHEQEMTDYVISENPKVTSVQWDWDSVDAVPVGLGRPFTDEMALNLYGKFNQIEDSRLIIYFDLDEKKNIIFDSMSTATDSFRVGGDNFE